MNILVGCEHSGTVRDAFAKLGHNAWSCDLLDAPGKHFNFGVFVAIDGPEAMKATKGKGWDIIILHPPCTCLAVSGNRTYGKSKKDYGERLKAMKWTKTLWNFAKSKANIGVALENPIGVLNEVIGDPAQIVHPYEFGHKEQKSTCLWLDRLVPLTPTKNVWLAMSFLPDKEKQKVWYASPGEDRAKIRSITYKGIADAMATQWGKLSC